MDNKRLVCLFEQICQYDVRLKYIPGAKNELADALSWNPPHTAEVTKIPNIFHTGVRWPEWITLKEKQ